jgi:chromosome partitioning protein
MQVIAFAASKGGVGKTTLAASLAIAAMEAPDARPFLIDLDPQGSLTAWGKRREAEAPPVDRIDPARLAAAVQGLAGADYTLAIIDTAGVDSAATAAAMAIADLTLIPARPSTLDIEGARPTLAALARLNRPYAFVLNACPPGRSYRLDDAGRALGLLGALATPPIVQRATHVDAIGLGLGVTEHAADSKAADEMRALWRWIARTIGTEAPHDKATTAVA